MDQGGALVDLRPYAAKLEWPVGIGTPHVQNASYPYLIQEKYRAGYFTHYAGEGTVRSAKICRNGEEIDLCLCRTKAHFSHEGKDRILTLDPVEIEFSDGVKAQIQTVITFTEGSSEIRYERKVLSISDPSASILIREYMTATYGTTEYPEDMTGVTLRIDAEEHSAELPYAYQCREADAENAAFVSCSIPQIHTRVCMRAGTEPFRGFVKEGYAFSPMFTIGYEKTVKEKEAVSTWLRLERED
jgi:hypothetical protein